MLQHLHNFFPCMLYVNFLGVLLTLQKEVKAFISRSNYLLQTTFIQNQQFSSKSKGQVMTSEQGNIMLFNGTISNPNKQGEDLHNRFLIDGKNLKAHEIEKGHNIPPTCLLGSLERWAERKAIAMK